MTPREIITINELEVEWVDSDDSFQRILSEQDPAVDYALDTEFIAGQSYFTELALVQIAWPDRIVLVDPYSVSLTPLQKFFEGPARALFHAAAGDLELLETAVGMRPRRLFDTQVAGQFLGLSTPSLAHLVQRYCNIALDKSHQRTDWTVRPLSNPVRHYAASDVAYLHLMVELMSQELSARGRLEWVESENEVVRLNPAPSTAPNELWWRLSRATAIPAGRQLGAQRLAILRDNRARGRNKPSSHILQDDALVAVATKPPKTFEELRKIKGCHSIPEPFAKEIIQLLHRAADESPGELQRLPGGGLPSELEPVVNVLLAVSNQRAADLELDPKILATRKDIGDFVQGNGSRLSVPWRVETITSDLHSVIQGEATVAIQDSRIVIRR